MTTNNTLAERGGANIMGPMGKKLMETLDGMSDDDMAQVQRMLSGEYQRDLLLRGDITEAMRDLRCKAAGKREYQQALTDLGRLMARMTPHGEAPNERGGTGEEG